MLYGMGTVFVFLTILVFATGLMSKIVNRLAPADSIGEADKQSPNASALAGQNTTVSPKVRAAIEKAIALHRQR